MASSRQVSRMTVESNECEVFLGSPKEVSTGVNRRIAEFPMIGNLSEGWRGKRHWSTRPVKECRGNRLVR